jgi:hypothetical protein
MTRVFGVGSVHAGDLALSVVIATGRALLKWRHYPNMVPRAGLHALLFRL